LPRDLLPTHYNIELRPDIYNGGPPFPFDGSVEIFFTCATATSTIILNSVGLEIDGVEFEAGEGTPSAPGVESFELDPDRDFLFIHLDDALGEGEHFVLRIRFSGTLNHPVRAEGCFWDSYLQDGETQYRIQ
jgi:aminopeptidase N